ncbi:unnamed protein product, partial [marine sediment metagenome]
MKKKVIVGMSGGVDSSVSLVLLKKQGWDVIGVSLKIPAWKGKRSFKNAKKVCQKLGVPHYLVDVRKDFQKIVIDYFIQEFKDNKTPNPCVICNRYLKFKALFDFAKKVGAKYIATGHYALTREIKNYQLLRAKDKV